MNNWDEKSIRDVYERIKDQAPKHKFVFHDPFWMLITTVLSQRTKDETTDQAALALYERYRTIEGLASADVSDVGSIISKVGFWRVKAKKIIMIAQIIRDEYGSKVPASMDQLLSLPGVGVKTASVVLAEGLGIPMIAVDTHVFRISHRIGWSSSKTPEQTAQDLMQIIPKDLWIGFNPTLVEFGKAVCRPVSPKCSMCRINEFCEYYKKKNSKEK
ncbi:endonuclease III [Thermoplasma volcanium GSS1]|uniref:Endonuclease III n=1 Tax=Thermoplasma volcanium (strain ATCC 51530 / DSM 4299 / JCM 9571 / NBRC 15438 / GSS1) TaxID=273116 RepID=Q97AJ2_THEVO|nr:endonuclease III [Thermoplasma volcanium]BAB59960.1 endonuclease III [Thermoplasma volcanium GSS1]